MWFASISKKWNIRLTVIDPWVGEREWTIGQLWEYITTPPDQKQSKKDPEPEFFLFNPKRLADFEGIPFYSDGRCDKAECLAWVKGQYRKLKDYGIISEHAKMLFTMLPVEQVF